MADGYDPRAPRAKSFCETRADFRAGRDTPSAYLARHIARIEAREPALHAFTVLDLGRARAAAQTADARYRAGKPVSPVDGLPIALKDIFEVAGLPTTWGVPGAPHAAWRDAAIVHALKKGGAVIVGKTALPELGFGRPAATVNPWDASRSPGGSSSGSAAATGAGLVPVAIGTQGKGSLTRPASYCGVFGFKPGHGTIHRGGDGGGQETNTHVGTLAAHLGDAWAVARWLSEEAGPHPGHVGIEGPAELPAAVKPKRLVRLEGPGRRATEAVAQHACDALLGGIAGTGVAVAGASEDAATRALEADMEAAAEALDAIADYESRWPLIMYLEQAKGAANSPYSDRVIERGLKRGQVARATYHEALGFRESYRAKLAACRAEGLFLVSPSATGGPPAVTDGSTGSSVYQWASSLAGNPVVSLPFMAVGGLPFGLQLQGFNGADAAMMAAARWLDEAFMQDTF